MNKYTKTLIDNMNRQELWDFVLEWREKNDSVKLEQQSYALDVLLEIVQNNSYKEGRQSVCEKF